jgi:hypothetical protein
VGATVGNGFGGGVDGAFVSSRGAWVGCTITTCVGADGGSVVGDAVVGILLGMSVGKSVTTGLVVGILFGKSVGISVTAGLVVGISGGISVGISVTSGIAVGILVGMVIVGATVR